MIYEDIYKEGNFYIIRKEIEGEMIEFGRFSDLDDAIEERDELEDYGWPYLNEDSEDKFVESNIYKENDKFIVSKKILDIEIIYGQFDTLEEAKSLKYILLENCWSLSPISPIIKYSKYITKLDNKFYIRKKFNDGYRFFGSSSSLDEAILIRDELVDNNWEMPEDKILENIDLFELKGENKFIGKSGRSYIVYNKSSQKITLYGYYSNLHSAMKVRDKLIANDWDISKMGKINYSKTDTKYITRVGNSFRISKLINGELQHFGHYPSLDTALEIRDKLIANDWDRKALGIKEQRERPDFNKNIQKISNGYSVIKRIDGELIVFDTFPTLSEAIEYRDFLEANNWHIDEPKEESSEEKYDEYIYLKSDGKYYIKNEIDGVMRIFGVFNDPLDAIAERLECIKSNWSSKSIPEDEYYENGFEKIDYSSSLTNYMKNEDVFDDESFYMNFRVTVGKSYKNKGWAVQRSTLEPFVPKIPYEKECTLFIEGIEVKAKLNIHTRLFYFTNKELSSYLEKLASIDPRTQARVDLELKHGNYILKDSEEDFISFKTTFSKSFKRGMFVIPREFSKEILPILPYEKESIFSIGDIDASGRFNLEFRIRFDANSIVPQIASMKEEGEELKVVLLLD